MSVDETQRELGPRLCDLPENLKGAETEAQQ